MGRFWEHEGFWAAMVIAIFIIGITDPPIWHWIAEEKRWLVIPFLILMNLGLAGWLLYYSSRLEDKDEKIDSLKREIELLEKINEQD